MLVHKSWQMGDQIMGRGVWGGGVEICWCLFKKTEFLPVALKGIKTFFTLPVSPVNAYR